MIVKIILPKKNEYAKIAVSLTGSKGQALRVFGKISTPRFTSGSILPKNLDSRRFTGCRKSISFFFFSFLGVKLFIGGAGDLNL